MLCVTFCSPETFFTEKDRLAVTNFHGRKILCHSFAELATNSAPPQGLKHIAGGIWVVRRGTTNSLQQSLNPH